MILAYEEPTAGPDRGLSRANPCLCTLYAPEVQLPAQPLGQSRTRTHRRAQSRRKSIVIIRAPVSRNLSPGSTVLELSARDHRDIYPRSFFPCNGRWRWCWTCLQLFNLHSSPTRLNDFVASIPNCRCTTYINNLIDTNQYTYVSDCAGIQYWHKHFGVQSRFLYNFLLTHRWVDYHALHTAFAHLLSALITFHMSTVNVHIM